MTSFSTLFLSRALPIIVMVLFTYVVPHFKRTYLITGLSGKNFHQTDVSHCQYVHTDTLIGCEDLHVYHTPSGPLIFTGCVEKLSDQFTWFPGITARNKSREGHYQAPFYVFEPAKDKVTSLEIENWPANTDRVWHGFDIFELSPGSILIYAINHRRTGSMIERFHHTIGSGVMTYERSFNASNDVIFTPNDVAVVGKDEFFVTNDHVAVDGLWRTTVDYLSLPMTHVAFHDPKTGYRIVASSVKGANGITAQKPGNKVFVSALTGGEMQVYERNATGDLKFLQKIELDFLPDNPCTPSAPTQLTLAITPGGDLLVTGIPNAKTGTNHDPKANVHSKIVRIPIAQLGDKFFGGGSGATSKPVVEDVLMDFTGKLNGGTTTVEVSYSDSDWIYSTSWRAVGLTRCKLS